MNLNDVVAVVNDAKAGELSLSKGGWEGWLQGELWLYLNNKNESSEREVSYPAPNGAKRCDLVAKFDDGNPLWVEIKAYGAFRQGDDNRFLDSIGLDVQKLAERPGGTHGLSLAVVPKAIGNSFAQALQTRRWNGFQRTDAQYVSIYHMSL